MTSKLWVMNNQYMFLFFLHRTSLMPNWPKRNARLSLSCLFLLSLSLQHKKYHQSLYSESSCYTTNFPWWMLVSRTRVCSASTHVTHSYKTSLTRRNLWDTYSCTLSTRRLAREIQAWKCCWVSSLIRLEFNAGASAWGGIYTRQRWWA